jgi:hypothetical protein
MKLQLENLTSTFGGREDPQNSMMTVNKTPTQSYLMSELQARWGFLERSEAEAQACPHICNLQDEQPNIEDLLMNSS